MRIFFDVDTQKDFMDKDGALYVPDAEIIKPNLERLTEHAKWSPNPIVGSSDVHFGTFEYKCREADELDVWGGKFPMHCKYGTEGVLRISETTLHSAVRDKVGYAVDPIVFPNSLNGEVNEALTMEAVRKSRHYKGEWKIPVYFEKQSYDVFSNPSTGKLLEIADVKEAVVYGVATDFCVKAAVIGMQQRGIGCYVVEDAIKGVFPEKTEQALEEMAKAGADFVLTKDVLEDRI